ncbi:MULTISPECIES: hypothetical protein [Mycobacterium]|uniref:Formate dehydrogenase H FdhF n=3 Tax=Mycobacterium intracellulare TaxID=1767 RepID=A0A220XTJ5_MYCIT|nr:formate dehydrogenase H FdhF [Mycobacterium intracellulare subsp. chimaera]KEF96597.1 hypothetical protein K883_03636 [Mycobacterium sp. TKK-01-0059]BCO41049.1 hypothetical protein MINTM001_21880 [Mycobacterium paraintracellulare]BCO46400.1 hypothetical protein MINTM002_20740 [Mycobacterium intracellulare]ASL14655.1 formate dehydrogenase H FdhF [Mycobacterium intracellulare subsp. chimaera]
MTRDCDGPDRVLENGCPLRCRLRRVGVTEERVDWAGLPVNLDFAFSRDQRDKVYAQHLMRRRLCVCEIAAEQAPLAATKQNLEYS